MLQLRVLRSISGRIRALTKRGLCQESSCVSQGSGDTQGYVPFPTNRSPHPAIHSTHPQAELKDGPNPHKTTQDELETLTPPKPPIAQSPKLAHTEVGLPSRPNTNQKRKSSTKPAQTQLEAITEISCSGVDYSPWPDDSEGQKAQKKAHEEDNKEYFKDHKASPLSEIEFADTRKPITQATDSNTGGGIILFKEEQLESAEETLMRAAEIWKWNKIRGDPHSPHGRVLRQLRGEFW